MGGGKSEFPTRQKSTQFLSPLILAGHLEPVHVVHTTAAATARKVAGRQKSVAVVEEIQLLVLLRLSRPNMKVPLFMVFLEA